MRVDELAPSPGSTKRPRRVGRGIGGKGGKTAGRGTKGQKARGRGKVARGFEGGQMPLKQRVPKLKGFNNPFRIEYQAVNLHTLEELTETEITPEVLFSHGLVSKGGFIKILGRGELTWRLQDRRSRNHRHGRFRVDHPAALRFGSSACKGQPVH